MLEMIVSLDMDGLILLGIGLAKIIKKMGIEWFLYPV
jgi:hypothetical protein